MSKTKIIAKPKAKPRGKPFKKKDPTTGEIDPRINMDGAPKRGASMGDQYDFVDQLTAEQIVSMLPPGDLRQAYQLMPKGVPMKLLKALRINAAIMFDPSAALVKEITDRTDGKVPDKIEHGGSLQVDGIAEILAKVYGQKKNDTNDNT